MANSKQFGPGQNQPHTDGRGQSGQPQHNKGPLPGQGGGGGAPYGGGAQPTQEQKRAQAMGPHGGGKKNR